MESYKYNFDKLHIFAITPVYALVWIDVTNETAEIIINILMKIVRMCLYTDSRIESMESITMCV